MFFNYIVTAQVVLEFQEGFLILSSLNYFKQQKYKTFNRCLQFTYIMVCTHLFYALNSYSIVAFYFSFEIKFVLENFQDARQQPATHHVLMAPLVQNIIKSWNNPSPRQFQLHNLNYIRLKIFDTRGLFHCIKTLAQHCQCDV